MTFFVFYQESVLRYYAGKFTSSMFKDDAALMVPGAGMT
jgi:hypothetical protein